MSYYANVTQFAIMSSCTVNVSILHYDVIMLDQHSYIPFPYANTIMLLYLCLGKDAWCMYVLIYMVM